MIRDDQRKKSWPHQRILSLFSRVLVPREIEEALLCQLTAKRALRPDDQCRLGFERMALIRLKALIDGIIRSARDQQLLAIKLALSRGTRHARLRAIYETTSTDAIDCRNETILSFCALEPFSDSLVGPDSCSATSLAIRSMKACIDLKRKLATRAYLCPVSIRAARRICRSAYLYIAFGSTFNALLARCAR